MKYIAYYRVSTKEQGHSGLGLDAQQASVTAFIKGADLIAEYTDIESGKNNNRPQLLKALQHTKDTGATLLIAKLDRLSRNMTFISTLMDAGVKFKCCDMPEADNFTIHIFAALAQKERELISSRTKAALNALKSKGVKLGKVGNLTDEGRARAGQAMKERASNNQNNKLAKAYALKCTGMTLQQITDELNSIGFKTATGKSFMPTQVSRLLT